MVRNEDSPLISVAIGTYNGAKWIERAVKSILSQTYQNFEIIICDDCSTDNTVEIVDNLIKTDSRVHLIHNSTNSGLNISLNRCIEVAKGDFIARMDDDDISLPERFERQISFLNDHPEIAFVGTSKSFFDDDSTWGQSIAKQNPTIKDIYTSHAFAHPTIMIRKEALAAVGNYSTDKLNRRGQDYDLWCKLYAAGYKGANLEDVLFCYYESQSSIKRRKLKFRIDHVRKELLWWKKLHLPVSYLRYPILDVVKCFIPKGIYSTIRKRKFK